MLPYLIKVVWHEAHGSLAHSRLVLGRVSMHCRRKGHTPLAASLVASTVIRKVGAVFFLRMTSQIRFAEGLFSKRRKLSPRSRGIFRFDRILRTASFDIFGLGTFRLFFLVAPYGGHVLCPPIVGPSPWGLLQSQQRAPPQKSTVQ